MFSNPSSAKKRFEKLQSGFSEYIEEEGKNWFITLLPDIPDMRITRMFYWQDNVIISGDIESYSTWNEGSGAHDPEPDTGLSGDAMKKYITENSREIRRFAVEKVSDIP